MNQSIGTEGVLSHLMFHKAMIDEEDDGAKIDRYLRLLGDAQAHIYPKNPLDGSIETVFDLVLSNNFDPWDIDLIKFSNLYAKKMRESEEINFIIAGKLVLMAWSILRMQSEEVLTEHSQRYDLFCADWDFDSLDLLSPESDSLSLDLCPPDEVELSEVVRHKGPRPVSLIELLDAFDEARGEVESHIQRQKERERRQAILEHFETKAHAEDMEKDVEEVWERIIRCGLGAITIEDICNPSKEDLIKVFVSLLFLARAGKIVVWQEDLPFGQIFLEVKMPWDIGTIEDAKGEKANMAAPACARAVI